VPAAREEFPLFCFRVTRPLARGIYLQNQY
jgi:hypothetical protein